jgi:heme-degrading monooxygenase HmoA
MAEEQNSEHVVSLLRYRMRDLTPAQHQEYSSTAERLFTLASAMPGFISVRHYTGDDGESMLVVEFASAAALAAWHDHPEHRKAQQRGRDDFFGKSPIAPCCAGMGANLNAGHATRRGDWRVLKLATRRAA